MPTFKGTVCIRRSFENDSAIAQYCKRLEKIYYDEESGGKANFRHRYSDIYSVLTEINTEESDLKIEESLKSNTESLPILVQNLQTLKVNYEPEQYDIKDRLIDITKEIEKLCDHVNLEVSHIDYTNKIMEDTNAHIKDLEVRIEKVDELMQKINGVQQQMEGMQREYITILGIFVAIVLAFTGGLSFTSSALESIGKSPLHRVLLALFVAGMVLFNLVWLLTHFIREINGKARKNDCCWLWVNLIFMAGIVGVCVTYNIGWLPV